MRVRVGVRLRVGVRVRGGAGEGGCGCRASGRRAERPRPPRGARARSCSHRRRRRRRRRLDCGVTRGSHARRASCLAGGARCRARRCGTIAPTACSWSSPGAARGAPAACEGGAGWSAGWGRGAGGEGGEGAGCGETGGTNGRSCRTHRAQLVVERRDAVVHAVHRPELGRRRGHAGRRRAARHLREARGARRACWRSLSRGGGGAGGGGGRRGGGCDDHGRRRSARAVRNDARSSGGHVRRRLRRRQRARRSHRRRAGWKGRTGFEPYLLPSLPRWARRCSLTAPHSLKVPAHDQPRAIEVEREGEGVQREYGRDGVDEVLAPGQG